MAVFPVGSPPRVCGNPLAWVRADALTYQDAALTTPAIADNDPVGGWASYGGSGSTFAQTSSTKRPLLKTAVRNGKSVLRFDGVNDFMYTAWEPHFRGTHMFVCKLTGFTGTYQFITAGYPNTAGKWLWWLDPVGTSNLGANSFFTFINYHLPDLSDFLLLTFWTNGEDIYARLNGDATIEAEDAGVSVVTGMSLGAQGGGTLPAAMDLAEYAAWPTVLSDAQILAAEAWMTTRWGPF